MSLSPLAPGSRVPEVSFQVRTDTAWSTVTTANLFAGKRVVAFSLPGAFTPTCSASHVPRYEDLYDAFRAAGIDDVLCIAVNDSFVMNAWKVAEGADHLTFVPDGNGTFTEAMGLLVDKSAVGFGPRSWRYAMVVNDGVIEKMFIEEELPGDPFSVSDADTVLAWLDAPKPPDVLLFTKPGCSYCAKAKAALGEHNVPYAELPTSPRVLAALPGTKTTPQVYVDGAYIGGADDLVAWLNAQ